MSRWAAFPCWWVRQKLLPALDATAQKTGVHIAALKIYGAIALSADFRTLSATITNDDLMAFTSLSRPMIKPAVIALENLGVISVNRDGYRHEYTLVQANGETRWMKMPYDVMARLLRELPNRGTSSLAALKEYFTFLAIRDGTLVRVSHETLQKYTGVRPNRILRGVDHLVGHGVVHVRQDDSATRPGRPSHIYTLLGDFGDRRVQGNPIQEISL